jgi:hypothetical protein
MMEIRKGDIDIGSFNHVITIDRILSRYGTAVINMY